MLSTPPGYQTIPTEFGLLSNLMYLDFKDNGLSGYIPDSFFDLKSLVRLDLSYNVNYDSNCTGSNGDIFEIPISFGIEGTILEDKIENLRYLMDIDLTDNYFSGVSWRRILISSVIYFRLNLYLPARFPDNNTQNICLEEFRWVVLVSFSD